MGTDSDRIPRETPAAGTNKIVMSRIEVADMFCPTTQMPSLFADGTPGELVIEEHVPTLSGEHPVALSRDSLLVPTVDLRASGLVPIDDRVCPPVESVAPVEKSEPTSPLALSQDDVATMNAIAAVNDHHLRASVIVDLTAPPVLPRGETPVVIDDPISDATMKHHTTGTSLGVAPLEPATTVRAPFVVDLPVPRSSPLDRIEQGTPPPIERNSVAKRPSQIPERERTAMKALDPSSGRPRSGPWQALVSVAKSLRCVRWWLRRNTSRVKPAKP